MDIKRLGLVYPRWLGEVGKRQPDDQLARSSSSSSALNSLQPDKIYLKVAGNLQKELSSARHLIFLVFATDQKFLVDSHPDSWRMTNEYSWEEGPLAGELSILSHP